MPDVTDSPALVVCDLVVHAEARRIVDGLSMCAPRGQVTAVVGPNGAGKSTTIEACAGLRTFDSGAIEVLGQAIRAGHAPAGIGVMLQDGGLYPTARPLELTQYVASLYPDPLDAASTLDRLGLDPGTRTTVRRLSGGEQQRLKAALALIGRPQLVFLDEPTAGLDAQGRRIVHDLVRELINHGSSVVITTHLMDDVEALAEQVVIVDNGRSILQAPVDVIVGTHEDVRFSGPAHGDLAGLRQALPAASGLRETSPGEYVATGVPDALSMSAIAAWCAQQIPAGRVLSVGRRSLAEAVDVLTQNSRATP